MNDGRQRGVLDPEAEIGGKSDRPEHTEMILGKPLLRGADGPDETDIVNAVADLFNRKFDEGQ